MYGQADRGRGVLWDAASVSPRKPHVVPAASLFLSPSLLLDGEGGNPIPINACNELFDHLHDSTIHTDTHTEIHTYTYMIRRTHIQRRGRTISFQHMEIWEMPTHGVSHTSFENDATLTFLPSLFVSRIDFLQNFQKNWQWLGLGKD